MRSKTARFNQTMPQAALENGAISCVDTPMSPIDSINPMQLQREELRFRRGVDYVHHAARGIKKINSSELVILNQIMTDSKEDPWRFEAAEIKIPTGKTLTLNLVSNPITRARDILGTAQQMAGNQDTVEAALYAYRELVLAHLFRDANRRTAVLATIWILESAGMQISPDELLEIPLGDLRNLDERESFSTALTELIKQSQVK